MCIYIYILNQKALTQSIQLGSFSLFELLPGSSCRPGFLQNVRRAAKGPSSYERAHKAHARHRGPPVHSACAFSTRSIWYAANNHSPYLFFQNRYSKMSCRSWAGGPRAKDNSSSHKAQAPPRTTFPTKELWELLEITLAWLTH